MAAELLGFLNAPLGATDVQLGVATAAFVAFGDLVFDLVRRSTPRWPAAVISGVVALLTVLGVVSVLSTGDTDDVTVTGAALGILGPGVAPWLVLGVVRARNSIEEGGDSTETQADIARETYITKLVLFVVGLLFVLVSLFVQLTDN